MVDVKRTINAFLLFGFLLFISTFLLHIPVSASEWGDVSVMPIMAALIYYFYNYRYNPKEKLRLENVKNSKHLYNKGVKFTKSKEYEQALIAYDQALTFNDKDPDIWNNKCYILNILAKYDEAVKAGNVAVQISSQDPQIWENLCNAYIGCNDREKADECQKNILKLKKTSDRY